MAGAGLQLGRRGLGSLQEVSAGSRVRVWVDGAGIAVGVRFGFRIRDGVRIGASPKVELESELKSVNACRRTAAPSNAADADEASRPGG